MHEMLTIIALCGMMCQKDTQRRYVMTATIYDVREHAFDRIVKHHLVNTRIRYPQVRDGLAFAREGRVVSHTVENDTIRATVVGAGKGTVSYAVEVNLYDDELKLSCSCAYQKNNGGLCKHIVASVIVAHADAISGKTCFCDECLVLRNGKRGQHLEKQYLRIDEKNSWEREMFTTFIEVDDKNKALVDTVAGVIGDHRGEIKTSSTLPSWIVDGYALSAAIVDEENLAERILLHNKRCRNGYAHRWVIGEFSSVFVSNMQNCEGDEKDRIVDGLYKRAGVVVLAH